MKSFCLQISITWPARQGCLALAPLPFAEAMLPNLLGDQWDTKYNFKRFVYLIRSFIIFRSFSFSFKIYLLGPLTFTLSKILEKTCNTDNISRQTYYNEWDVHVLTPSKTPVPPWVTSAPCLGSHGYVILSLKGL